MAIEQMPEKDERSNSTDIIYIFVKRINYSTMKKINFQPFRNTIYGFLIYCLFFSGPISAQLTEFNDLSAIIPVDSAVTKGKFDTRAP